MAAVHNQYHLKVKDNSLSHVGLKSLFIQEIVLGRTSPMRNKLLTFFAA